MTIGNDCVSIVKISTAELDILSSSSTTDHCSVAASEAHTVCQQHESSCGDMHML